mgnify:CR=1 FL=1
MGGYAFHSGCSIRYLEGDRGIISAEAISKNINPEDVHKTITKLVSLENTSNRGGGKIFPIAEIENIKKICDTNQLNLHLDGSRLFNALVETKEDASESVSYTHLRAHETVLDLVCRLLLEKKTNTQ